MTTEKDKQTDHEMPADGDYAPYGFGHPAHLPDPNAKYAFEPDVRRVLPLKPDKRWRVPG